MKGVRKYKFQTAEKVDTNWQKLVADAEKQDTEWKKKNPKKNKKK